MEYYVCHTRGPDFDRLRELGFITFYPTMDDYVFLPKTEETAKLLRKQTELCIAFVKSGGQYVLVTQAEIDRMKQASVPHLKVGEQVHAVEGVGAGLDGVVLEMEDTKLLVEFEGYKRTYQRWVDAHEVVRKEDDKADNSGG